MDAGEIAGPERETRPEENISAECRLLARLAGEVHGGHERDEHREILHHVLGGAIGTAGKRRRFRQVVAVAERTLHAARFARLDALAARVADHQPGQERRKDENRGVAQHVWVPCADFIGAVTSGAADRMRLVHEHEPSPIVSSKASDHPL